MDTQMNPSPDVVISHPPKFPTEIWEAIFWKLSSPGDLYNISITSRYIYNIVNPILYDRLFLDQNHYSTYTLYLLKQDSTLASRVKELTLLPTITRNIPACLRIESEMLYRTLDIPYPSPIYISPPVPLGIMHVPDPDEENSIRPIFHFFPSFTALTVLHVVYDCIPVDFFDWIFELPQLTTLEIRNSMIALDLMDVEMNHTTPLPIRTLSILRCWTSSDVAEGHIPSIICGGLLKNAPLLTSLTVDLFIERMACLLLSEMDHPPPIQSLSCHGLGSRDPHCALFCAMLLNLPTITTLSMTRAPRELGSVLPGRSLPHIRTLTGQLKTLRFFFEVDRPLQYLTIIDCPYVPGGCTPWESQLICFFESLRRHGTDLKGLAFNLSAWSEEVFLCVCQLWPGLKELRIQCTEPGVDEYFRISFGPRFLLRLQNLEVLHIYRRESKHNFTMCHMSKGVPVVTYHPLSLSAEAAEELAEAPIHYRRWEKVCPSLREVAFDRHIWWRRMFSERGGWALMREIIPTLSEEW